MHSLVCSVELVAREISVCSCIHFCFIRLSVCQSFALANCHLLLVASATADQKCIDILEEAQVTDMTRLTTINAVLITVPKRMTITMLTQSEKL